MRISIARKNLFREKFRFTLSVGGVALSVLLMLILLSLYRGINEASTRYIDATDAEIWVLQEGSLDIAHSISIIHEESFRALEKIEGIQDVNKLIIRRTEFDLNNTGVSTVIVGYNTNTGAGGSTNIVEGKSAPAKGEIIADEAFSEANNISIGDTLTINNFDLEVVGISEAGPVFPYSFVTIEDSQKIFNTRGSFSYGLVTVEEGYLVEEVADTIRKDILGLDAVSQQRFADINGREISETFLPVILVLVGIGFIVGLTIISLTIYTATVEKERDFGVLKAIGAKHSQLYRIVFEQSLILGLVGYFFGVGLTFLVADIAGRSEAFFITLIVLEDLVYVAILIVIMALVSGFLPVRKIINIDPSIVFKR